LTAPGDCSFFLVEVNGGKCVLIDCGVGEGHASLVEKLGMLHHTIRDVEALILTHCHIDHIGDARRIKEESGCYIIGHEGDKDAIEGRKPKLTAASWYGVDYQPVEIDRLLREVEVKMDIEGVEFNFIHTPGHTPGSISVYIDDDGERVLFGQDIHGPFDESWGSDMHQWKDSMKRLLALDADILCEGHFGVFTGKQAVKDYIEGYLNNYKG